VLLRFADNRNPNSLASRMRRRRMQRFTRLLGRFPEPVRVLDVGGSPAFWKVVRAGLPKLDLTLLNLTAADVADQPATTSVAGDARRLTQFQSGEFDVCFSNSVIEHVGTLDDQAAMASEVRRVARGYFVQTPYRYFPIEAHFHVPGWQLLPLELRARLHQRFDLGWQKRQPQLDAARTEVAAIRLLTVREYERLFPEAKIHFEWVGPLIKSLMAIHGE
jgi:hypothetical protein